MSSVTVKPVQTVWPIPVKMPGDEGNMQSPYSRVITGRGVNNCRNPVMLLWTTCLYSGQLPVNTNHFVPLFERDLSATVDAVPDGDAVDMQSCSRDVDLNSDAGLTNLDDEKQSHIYDTSLTLSDGAHVDNTDTTATQQTANATLDTNDFLSLPYVLFA